MSLFGDREAVQEGSSASKIDFPAVQEKLVDPQRGVVMVTSGAAALNRPVVL